VPKRKENTFTKKSGKGGPANKGNTYHLPPGWVGWGRGGGGGVGGGFVGFVVCGFWGLVVGCGFCVLGVVLELGWLFGLCFFFFWWKSNRLQMGRGGKGEVYFEVLG